MVTDYPVVTPTSDMRREHVRVTDILCVDYKNIAWVMNHLTARLRCDVINEENKTIHTQDGLKDLSLHNALRYVKPNGLGNEVKIYHNVSTRFGGISCCRNPFDTSQWLITIIPETRKVNGSDVDDINFIGRELFLSAKYATQIEGDNIFYTEPIYFHPKYRSGSFDPSYFTAA